MPPALSDDESMDDGPDMIPAKGKIPTKEEEAAAEEEDEDEDDDEDGEEYRVEKVLKHAWDGSEISYQIKWLGYEKKEDLTWEPLENLENAQEALDEYHKKIGGPPEPPASKKKGKGGKRSASAAFDPPAVEASGKKRGKKSEVNGTPSKAELPAGSWEADIQRVTSIIEEDEVKPKSGKQLIGLVEWVDGKKTQHKMDVLRRKCPQKLLNYYEQHLVFKNDSPAKEDE